MNIEYLFRHSLIENFACTSKNISKTKDHYTFDKQINYLNIDL